ncbi:MAG: hypothetical protein ABL871_05715 [Terricaulis sp.]
MRDFVLLAAFVAAACSAAPSAPAAAITPSAATAWTSPDGVISVTIPAGWENAEDASADEQRLLTVASPTQIQSQQSLRQCSVELRRDPDLTQAMIDAAYESATALSLLGPPSLGNEVRAFAKTTINGVRVISIDRQMGDFRQLQVNFAIRSGDAASRYTVACGAGGGENADIDIAAMQEFISSLSINARTNP